MKFFYYTVKVEQKACDTFSCTVKAETEEEADELVHKAVMNYPSAIDLETGKKVPFLYLEARELFDKEISNISIDGFENDEPKRYA